MELIPILLLVLCCPVLSLLIFKHVFVLKETTPAKLIFYILFVCEFISLLVFIAFVCIGNPSGISEQQHINILGYSALMVIVFYIAELAVYMFFIRKHKPHK